MILFVNTALSEQDSGYYGDIFDDVWKHAVVLTQALRCAQCE